MLQIKRTNQAAGAELLTEVLGATPPALLKLGVRVAFQLPQSLVQTMTTNVPGPAASPPIRVPHLTSTSSRRGSTVASLSFRRRPPASAEPGQR